MRCGKAKCTGDILLQGHTVYPRRSVQRFKKKEHVGDIWANLDQECRFGRIGQGSEFMVEDEKVWKA